MSISPEHTHLYMSLFRGRQDVYARRWEKGDKHGWSPAYSFDWDEFNAHRASGGTMEDFQNKTYTPFTSQVLSKHLEGKELLGIYPIFLDNTSYFLFATKYCFGLTATHERQFGKEKIAELMIGGVIGELESHKNVVEQSFDIRCIQTDIFLPFRYSTSHYETLAKTICYDTGRNQLIVKEVMTEVKNGRKVLLLTERKEHIEILLLYLKTQCECITLSGDDAKSAREMKMKQVRDGHYSVIIATGQFLGEGIDVPGIESLVLAFPFGFKGKLIQYIGRMRGAGVKSIINFCDAKYHFSGNNGKVGRNTTEKNADIRSRKVYFIQSKFNF